MVGAWLFGSCAIGGIVWLEAADSPYRIYPYVVCGLVLLGFAYMVFSLALNRTTVRIESGKIFVGNGPLPWGSNSSIDLADVAGLFVSSRMTMGAKGPGGRSYTVLARLVDGSEAPVVIDPLLENDGAEDLARRIEAMLPERS